MQQVQKVNQIKINIARIIDDCKKIKYQIPSSQRYGRQQRLKTAFNQKQQINKTINLDSFIKNMNSRVRSLRSAQTSCPPALRRNQSVGVTTSQFQTNQELLARFSLQKRSCPNSKDKFKQYFPKLMAKYRRAHHPKNASSSQRCRFLDKNQKLQVMNEQDYLTFHSIQKQRRKEQQLQHMSLIGRLVKQRVLRQKKQLVKRQRQRKLQSVSIKQIVLKKLFTSIN